MQCQRWKKFEWEPTCWPKHKHTWQISRTRVYVQTTQLSPLFVKDDTYRKYFSLLLWNAKLWKFRETSTKFGCWYTTWKLSRNYGNYTGNSVIHILCRGWEPQSKTTGVAYTYLYALYVSCSITKEESSLYLLLSATTDYESSVAFKKIDKIWVSRQLWMKEDFVGICSMNSFGDGRG